MIITKSTPYTKEEIEKLRESFDVYIKTVIDVEKKFALLAWIDILRERKYYLTRGQNNQIFGEEASTWKPKL